MFLEIIFINKYTVCTLLFEIMGQKIFFIRKHYIYSSRQIQLIRSDSSKDITKYFK